MRTVGCALLLAAAACSANAGGGPEPTSDAGTRPPPPELPVPPPPGTPGWYVDAVGGDDGNDGRTVATAFRTIDRALGSASSLAAGDVIFIKAGLYRERIRFQSSGTPGAPIVIRAYGDGEVIIDASPAVTGWTPAGGNLYRASIDFTPMAVVADDRALFPESSLAAVGEGEWYASGGTIHVWLPGGGSPADRDVGVIDRDPFSSSSPEMDAIQLFEADDVTLSFLTVRFASGHGISVIASDRVTVEGCRAWFNGKAGITFGSYGDSEGEGCEARGNDVYFNVMTNWPRGAWQEWCGGGWPAALSGQGVKALRLTGNRSRANGGEGILSYGSSGGVIMEGNVAEDNWSANIYMDNEPDGIIRNNVSIAHEPDPLQLLPASRNRLECLKRLRPNGILTADEDYGEGARLRNVLIANNVIIGTRRAYGHNAQIDASGMKSIRFVNNTIVLPDSSGYENDGIVGLQLSNNEGENVGSLIANNIIHGRHPRSLLMDVVTDGAADPLAGLTLSNNLWFHAGNTRPIRYSGPPPTWSTDDYTTLAWRAEAGSAHGAGDVDADPLLRDPSSYDPAMMRVRPGSPAIDRGTDTGLANDFDYDPRPVRAYDIGAFEEE